MMSNTVVSVFCWIIVDQFDGLLAGGRVEFASGSSKSRILTSSTLDTRQTDALLLPARKLVRGVIQVVFDSHQFSDAAGRLVHFFLRSAAVFQRKGDIFPPPSGR